MRHGWFAVTCIQFNPVDDDYFLSGSLDAKIRIWSVPNRQVVDWMDVHEMVTAACYTPDGQVASDCFSIYHHQATIVVMLPYIHSQFSECCCWFT